LTIISYGLLLIFTSVQANLFTQLLYPPFGIISLLFSGFSLYAIFIGFYASSIYIINNYRFVKNLTDKAYQFEFFRNIAKSEFEKQLGKIINDIQMNKDFNINEKTIFEEVNKENVEEIITLIKEEIKKHKSNEDQQSKSI